MWLFSPEQWTDMRLSKHHYASALARAGNRVFFIEPGNKISKQIKITEVEPGLKVVNHPLLARGWGKLPYFLYRLLLLREVNFLKKHLGGAPDVAWCFDPLRVVELNMLQKSLCIYHPVDQFDEKILTRYPLKTKFAFSTMPVEVEKLKQNGFQAFFITHGLNPAFANFAQQKLAALEKPLVNKTETELPIKVGFSGNLLGEAYDRETMRAIIEANPDCEFHFWGKTENPKNYIRLGSYNPEFIAYLKSSKNCVVHGIVSTEALAAGLNEMDMVWVIWKNTSHPQWNENTNPHKMMEYISTGLPVMSHYMSIYKNYEWLDMAKQGATLDDYLLLFKKVKHKALQLRSSGRGADKEKLNFALSNTYKNHVKQIEALI